jgi:hypothetical protein
MEMSVACYYTLSTISQTLAGAFGLLLAVVLYRLQALRDGLPAKASAFDGISVPVAPLDGSPAGGPGIRWSKASIFPQSRQKGAEADLLPIPTAWTHRLGARGDRVDRNVPGGPPRPQGSCDLLSGAAVRPLRSDHTAGYFDSLTEGRAERKFARDQARPGHARSAVSPPRPATLRRWREVRRGVPGGHAERTRDGTQRATGTASRGHAWREPGGRLA